MSKIAFVNPSQNLESVYGRLSREASKLAPLGLCYLASAMKEVGHEVKIIDGPALKISNKETVSLALQWGARYVGITATTDIIFLAGEIAEEIKSRSKDVRIIIGGAHVTAVPEDTFARFASFDFGVIGEGEETLRALISAFECNHNLGKVDGIVYRKGGKIIITPHRKFIEDLDSLPPPAWDLLPRIDKFYKPTLLNYKRLPSASLVTSRGCPGRCAFCDTKVFGSRYRVHSAEYVLKMIRHLKQKYGIRDICFYDDVFTLFKKRLAKICEGLMNNVMRMHWSCQARVNAIDRETMKMMKDAGCWKISFGIESASDNILKLMNKNATAEQAKKAIFNAKSVGLEVEGYFILGFFGEDKKSLQTTKEFIVNSNLDVALLSYFLPLPGSPAYSRTAEYGRFNEDWRSMNAFDSDRPQFVPYGLNDAELIKAQKDVYRSFYFRPKTFLKFALKMIKNPAWAFRFAKSFLSFIDFVFKRNTGHCEQV